MQQVMNAQPRTQLKTFSLATLFGRVRLRNPRQAFATKRLHYMRSAAAPAAH